MYKQQANSRCVASATIGRQWNFSSFAAKRRRKCSTRPLADPSTSAFGFSFFTWTHSPRMWTTSEKKRKSNQDDWAAGWLENSLERPRIRPITTSKTCAQTGNSLSRQFIGRLQQLMIIITNMTLCFSTITLKRVKREIRTCRWWRVMTGRVPLDTKARLQLFHCIFPSNLHLSIFWIKWIINNAQSRWRKVTTVCQWLGSEGQQQLANQTLHRLSLNEWSSTSTLMVWHVG